MKILLRPLTPSRWPDLETVFGAAGCSVARNCWCMYYRRSGSRGDLPAGITHAQANRAELKALVDSSRPPGLIGYAGKVPVGVDLAGAARGIPEVASLAGHEGRR